MSQSFVNLLPVRYLEVLFINNKIVVLFTSILSIFGDLQSLVMYKQNHYMWERTNNSCLIIPMIHSCFLVGFFCDFFFFNLVLEEKNASVLMYALYIRTASLIGVRS